MAAVTMQYGDYQFSPVPLMSWQQERITNDNGDVLHIRYTAELTGWLVSVPGSVVTLVDLQNELKEAFSCENCKLFEIKCGTTTLFSMRPEWATLEIAQGNWIQRVEYTISISWVDASLDECVGPPFVNDVTNEWTIEPINDPVAIDFDITGISGCSGENHGRLFTLTHNISAIGVPSCDATGGRLEAWEAAKDWVTARLGVDTSIIDASGSLNNSGPYSLFDHFRSVNIGKASGSYGVTESWVVVDPQSRGIAYPAKETFTIETNEDASSGLTSITVSGTITGYEGVDYNTGQITTTRYANAVTYWNKVAAFLYCRAQIALGDEDCQLNIEPVTKTVARNITSGVITYSYTYNNRASRLIPGSKNENIQISYQNPTDVYAELFVFGRQRGPILQGLNTITKSCLSVSVEVTMSGCNYTDCLSLLTSPKTDVEENVLCCIEGSLTGSYNQVFKTEDSGSWQPTSRRYTRNVTWCYQDCTGSAESTSLCQ